MNEETNTYSPTEYADAIDTLYSLGMMCIPDPQKTQTAVRLSISALKKLEKIVDMCTSGKTAEIQIHGKWYKIQEKQAAEEYKPAYERWLSG